MLPPLPTPLMKGVAASLLESGVLDQLEEISRSYTSSITAMLREAMAAGAFGADFEAMYSAATRAAVLHVRTAVDGPWLAKCRPQRREWSSCPERCTSLR